MPPFAGTYPASVERTPDGEYIDAPVAEDLEPVANLVAATDNATSDARWWPKNTRRRVAPTAARWLQSWLSPGSIDR